MCLTKFTLAGLTTQLLTISRSRPRGLKVRKYSQKLSLSATQKSESGPDENLVRNVSKGFSKNQIDIHNLELTASETFVIRFILRCHLQRVYFH